jgi:uncharacterized membrane protein
MSEVNVNTRLEAFCDAVFAVAITLLVIEIKSPMTESLNSVSEFWISLYHLIPSFSAFLLSFLIIFISWVNHHGTLKLLNKSSPAFIYANGFLMLTIVLLPFATSLLSENLFTNFATPAVVVYSAVNGLQALAWILLGHSARYPSSLARNDRSASIIHTSTKGSFIAFVIYSMLTILAFWFPLVVASSLGIIWIGWLIYGIKIKSE